MLKLPTDAADRFLGHCGDMTTAELKQLVQMGVQLPEGISQLVYLTDAPDDKRDHYRDQKRSEHQQFMLLSLYASLGRHTSPAQNQFTSNQFVAST